MMSKVQTIVLVISLLTINNIGLLYFLGDDSENQQRPDRSISTPSTEHQATENTNIENIDVNTTDISVSRDKLDLTTTGRPDQVEAELEQAVEAYMTSQDFVELLDAYRTKAQQRQIDLHNNYQSMTAAELLNAYQGSTDKHEKKTILQYLANTDLSQIETYQIEQFYTNSIDEEIGNWMKSKLVTELIDRQGDGALNLAKQFLSESNHNPGEDFEVLAKVFEYDRDFIVDLASNMSIDELANSFIFSTLSSDSSAANDFFENQIDNNLNADNSKVYEKLHTFGQQITLSTSQQEKVSDLMLSKKSPTRRFALGLTGSIDDISLLRRRFEGLQTPQDRQSFIHGLSGNIESEGHAELIRELTSNSTDPQMQQLGRYLVK